MLKKLYFTFLTLALFSSLSIAQNAMITGQILDNAESPIIGANVSIANQAIGSQSDENGYFTIKNIPSGNQTLVISYIGYKTQEIPVVTSTNSKTELGVLTLYEGNELLQKVKIVSSRDNKFSRKKTAYVSKLPLRDMENPTVYSTVTTELLESQIVTNFDDAIVNATGISKLWESTGRAPGEGTGYFSTRGFSTQPELVDGMPGFTFSAVDPSYIERIEVIKGPAATLFGSTVTSLGGLINVVTKKPYQGFGGSASYTLGSFNMHRGALDVNTPLGKANNMFFRVNASYLTQESFQDAGFRRTFFVAPSLTYRVNNRLNLSLGVEYSKTKQTNPSMLFVRRGLPLVAKNVEELGVDPEKSFTSDDVFLTTPIFNTRAIADYKISDKWTSQTVLAGNHTKAYGYYQYMIEGAAAAFGVLQPLAAVPGVQDIIDESNALLQTDAFARIFDKRDASATKFNIQQNFTGDYKIGKMRNRTVIGLDFVSRQEESNNRSGNSAIANTPTFSTLLATLTGLEQLGIVPENTALGLQSQLTSFPYFDGLFTADGKVIPNSYAPNASYSPTTEQLDAIFNEVPARKVETASATYAGYISNVLSITDQLTTHVGLRLDYFDQEGDKSTSLDDFTKTTFSPSLGVVYQPIKDKVTLFTNYQTGFVNNNPDINADGTVQNFEPTKAKQFEGGVKTNFLNGKVNVGVSYYHITAENILNIDPRLPIFPVSLTLNEVVSQGFELEVNANPIKGLNLRASYSNNDKKITDAYSPTTDITYPEYQDKRPENAGPQHIYNFWADYKLASLENKYLKNIGVGFGFNGTSEHLTRNNSSSGAFTLPSYTVFNAALYYNADQYRIGFKVNNLTDEIYYKGWGTVNAQPPRDFVGTVTYRF